MATFPGDDIRPEEIISTLKKNLQLKEICQHIRHQRIIDQVAEERNLQVTPEEIQEVADQQRYSLRLFRASDAFAWLQDQMMTAEEWEAGISDRLLMEKLAHHLFDAEARKYLTEHQAEYEQVSLYRLVVPFEKLAQELFYEIQEAEISFYEAAHIYDVDEKRRLHCGYEGKFYRWNLKPDLSAIVFSTAPGKVIGPLMIDEASHLLLVEEFIAAELTPELHQEIRDRMFKEWLVTELTYRMSL